uniref:Uncharacterized protein LOC111137742 isoform X3 n=1 Tax=Crassostrea virginica TaxID=6565 RepID=A0A8B8EYS2_CRAVI|nr:uncharacterized protein LOC111137742 isoform X3 [Crassostrea virginica]
MWERVHECYDLSVLQQIISLVLLLFSRSYIVYGGVNILTLHGNHPANTTITCDPEFYDYYFHAKIVQLPVYAVYAVYYFVFLFFVVPMEKKWFLRRKLRQWVRILDADQDGIISQEDMNKTNEKMECLRQLVGGRESALPVTDQTKWWNENVFRCGPGKDISENDLTNFMFANVFRQDAGYNDDKMKPIIKGWFEFFTTEEYLKENWIIEKEDFCKFWTILAQIEHGYSTEMLNRYFPSPITMSDLLEEFVTLVSNPMFYEVHASRIFHLLKYRPKDTFCKS